MSNGEKEWGGMVTGDTCAAMLSSTRGGGSRTDPPDKSEAAVEDARGVGATGVAAVSPEQNLKQRRRRSFSPAGSDATSPTLEPGGNGRPSPHHHFHPLPPPPLSSTTTQPCKLPLSSRHSEPDPVQDSGEFKCAAETQPCSHGQHHHHAQQRHTGVPRRYSYGKDPAARQQYAPARSENVTSDPSVTQDGVRKVNKPSNNFRTSASETDASPGSACDDNGSQAVNFGKDYAAVRDKPESTLSTPPRLVRCRRQSRVQSPEEPDSCYVIPKTESFSDNNFNTKQESYCKLYLDGKSLDISTEKVSIESEEPSSVFFTINGHDVVTHRLSSDTKRSSADRESVISVTTSDDRQSESWEQPAGKKKRKKKNRLSRESDNNNSRSNLSLSAANRGSNNGEVGGGGGSNADDDNANRPPSSCSSTKGSQHHNNRRFAKRGLGGVFPSSNWRRLRNTLKAANEMQSTKKTKHTLNREDSFLRKFSTRNHQNVQGGASQSNDEDVPRYHHAYKNFDSRLVLQHDGNFMFYWLGVVTVAVMYNIWTPIAREAFREIQDGCHICWFSFDALFDVIYVLDIVVQFRTGYLDQGLMVYDSKKLRKRYTRSKVIYVDFLSLFPLDLVQIFIGIHPMIRFPRFLKVYRTFRFVHMMESRTAYPNLIRVANLTHILFLGAHWFAAFYYMISEAEGFQGDWAYPKPEGEFAYVTRKYLRSLFWSTLTLTTIGDITPPEHNHEYVFLIVSYLIGVFVFATIVGQVGNVINNRNASRQEFERLLDGAKIYMQTHNVPHNLQKRVQRWYDYVWSRGRLNGCDINSLGLLPDKLKTELAIHVNLETLKKVTIFQECQPEFLHDLVLKMKAYIFTPGDLICRRGEVAREMFIIADGVVEIISETGVMLKRMGAGDFFGEIGILNLDGGINRRTADVRSVGYLELFVLSREDVLEALKDHPEAESIIRDYGQRRLREVEAHRQKVKPLKCRGSTDQQGSISSGPQTVQNRLLQTLRNLNPTVRRQSAQMNHLVSVSPPAAAAPTGNGPPPPSSGNNQRCVNQQPHKDSVASLRGEPPACRASSIPVNATSPLAQGYAGRPSAPADHQTPPADGGGKAGGGRAPVGRRQGFGYLRAACSRFRCVFYRRNSKRRRSADCGKLRGNSQIMGNSFEDRPGLSDHSNHSSPMSQKCNIKLNIETCVDGSPGGVNGPAANSDGEEESNEVGTLKEVKDKSSLFGGVKRGSLLIQGYFEGDSGLFGPRLVKGNQRKFSEPVAYMPVCTEDLDEPETQPAGHKKNIEGGPNPACAVKFGHSSDMDSPLPLTSAESCQPLELSNSSTLSFTPDSKSGSFNDPETLPDLTTSSAQNNPQVDSHLTSSQCTSTHIETSESRPVSSESSQGTFSPSRNALAKHPVASSSSVAMATVSKHSPARSRKSPSSNSKPQIQDAPQQPPPGDSKEDLLTVPATPLPCLVNATPSPFSLLCQCDPADNFAKLISRHLPETYRQRLIRKNAYLAVQNPKLTNKFRTSSDSDAPEGKSTLAPCGANLGLRSQSFPRLSSNDTSVVLTLERGQNSDGEGQFTFETQDAEISPNLNRVKQMNGNKSFERQGSGAGRSQAMSIIQSPASDLSHQQITTQLQLLQGVIDKRLTQLEEVYVSTFSRLDKMAESQDMLVRLVKQLMHQQREKAAPLAVESDQDKLPASVV